MLHVSIITNNVNLRDFIKLYIIFSVLSEAFFFCFVSPYPLFFLLIDLGNPFLSYSSIGSFLILLCVLFPP